MYFLQELERACTHTYLHISTHRDKHKISEQTHFVRDTNITPPTTRATTTAMATTARKPRTTATTTTTTIPASAATNTMLCVNNQSLCHTTPKPTTTSKTTATKAATHTHTHTHWHIHTPARTHIHESTYTNKPRQPETKECNHTLTMTHKDTFMRALIQASPPP